MINNKGITLIALVITIIVMLILAGVTIMMVVQGGLFGQATRASEENRGAQVHDRAEIWRAETTISGFLNEAYVSPEEIIEDLYNQGLLRHDELFGANGIIGSDDMYNGGYVHIGTRSIHFRISGSYVPAWLSIGDWVAYTPDSPTTSYEVLGSHATSNNGANVIHHREDGTDGRPAALQWRVFDILPNGQVRLISATPTGQLLTLHGANGYNNAVRLIDEISSIYGGTRGTAQGLKIEDIEKHMTDSARTNMHNNNWVGTQHTVEGTNSRAFPNIWREEQGSVINGESTGGTLGLSQQRDWVEGSAAPFTETSITVTDTSWEGTLQGNHFTELLHHQLIMRNPANSAMSQDYWLSSRSTLAGPSAALFRISAIRAINAFTIQVNHRTLMGSYGGLYGFGMGVRPVVTLNSSVRFVQSEGPNSATNPHTLL